MASRGHPFILFKMKKDIIVLIFVTCVLGGLNVSFNYHNWSKPQLDTSCISNATPDINNIDIEGVRLFSLYTNFFESFGLDYKVNIESSTTESLDLDSLDEKNEVEEESTSALVAEIPEIVPRPPLPPPPPPQIPDIEIVDDEEEIEEELEIENVELDEDTEIEIVEEDEEDDTPYNIVEIMPALGPCKSMRGEERNNCTQMEIMKYISENIEYPPIAKDAGIQGKVFVKFVVGKDGNVKDVKVIRGVDSRLDKEAKRVVSSLPKFEPGTQRGKKVNVQYTVPINFKFVGSTKSKNTEENAIEIEEEVNEGSVKPKNEKKRKGKRDRKKKKK
ncbi:MAG: hypothetical protein CL847_05175 [Crocinitomicaceae bacterium]|nr:hypothetical protein [Crocinitomicaceae bacterium]